MKPINPEQIQTMMKGLGFQMINSSYTNGIHYMNFTNDITGDEMHIEMGDGVLGDQDED